ncbi:hypothetical protein PR202_ga29763 [Eleusine coracana subsp. coracana]|uniref:Fungal lipase-like domain-containing protein n=1 Tax=Eleusine coracana subsp. coracana TaxID=191504 RepID=A0AAV5DKJ2_ELECO|nr:hypothetical protein PR202_ga29763 [Eleusine coracana subsp. coracana]
MGTYDDFSVSGPTHMMGQPGSSPVHHCLPCKGTYVLESDHTNGTKLAPSWWESFHFRQLKVLSCACTCIFCKIHGSNARFICGVIFEYVPPDEARHHPSAPRYIVAFRGTMPKDPTIVGDLRLNLRVLLNMQQLCHRFCEAREFVEKLVTSNVDGDSSTIWLTGHSLGASIALDVGREMMMGEGINLPTFLFNPPHVSLAPVANKVGMSEEAKQDVHLGSYVVKHIMGKTILRPQKKHMEAVFEKLSPWVPELYVHQRDPICSGFIDYFELRKQHQEQCPRIAKSAATLAYRDLLHPCAVSGFGDKKGRQHLLPSARLWKNLGQDGDAHGLQQWWRSNLSLSSERYSWP